MVDESTAAAAVGLQVATSVEGLLVKRTLRRQTFLLLVNHSRVPISKLRSVNNSSVSVAGLVVGH